MSETAFQFFFWCFDKGTCALYAALLAAFFYPSLGSRRGWKTLLILGAYALPWSFCGRLSGLAAVFLLLLGAKALGLSRGQVFLWTLLYYNTKMSSGLLVGSFHFLLEEQFPYLPVDPGRMYLRSALSISGMLLCHGALLAALLYALWRRLRREELSLSGGRLWYLSLLPAAGILFGQIISSLFFEVKDGVFLQLYERHPLFMGLVPLLAMLLYAGTYLTIALQQNMTSLQREQAERFLERQQTRLLQEQLQETERLYDGLRRMRHELRGHLTAIQGLASGGHCEELVRYIARMDGTIASLEPSGGTGNPVMDVIVESKRREAEALGVSFRMDFHYPDTAGYDAFDLGIILQNLLQNALDANRQVPEEERRISLTGRKKGKFFLIEVENAVAETVVFGTGGLPVTTKTEASGFHGLGLSNVRREVGKYMGDLELKTDGRTFCATVLLQEHPQKQE